MDTVTQKVTTRLVKNKDEKNARYGPKHAHGSRQEATVGLIVCLIDLPIIDVTVATAILTVEGQPFLTVEGQPFLTVESVT
jgi:hypothetical protein